MTSQASPNPHHRRKGFLASEDGSSSIEFALWVPLMAFMLILITDASFIYFGRTQTLRLLQDANRALSVGRLNDADETEQYLLDALADLSPNADVTSVVDAGVVTTTAEIPASDLMPIATIPYFSDLVFTVRSQQYLEY